MEEKQPQTNPIIDDDRVKTFLKIRLTDEKQKPYYTILENKQKIQLMENTPESEKTIIFQIDKIFTNKDENSYIYEEITRDCISECLNKKHFTFISYGDSNSDKNSMIFGEKDSYKNINSRGLFPRLLFNLVDIISQNKTFNENYNLNISYLCINKNKLIDLSKLFGKNFMNYTQKDFMNNANEIRISQNMAQKFKKVPVDNPNDVLFFLCQVFELLYKIELDNLHLYSWSHFVFILYINDNNGNLISTISFIILAGSERLPTKVTHPKISGTYLIDNTKNLVDNQYTFDNVVKNICTLSDLHENSKLVAVLKDYAFNNKINRKYRVIGSILPTEEAFLNVKDTLMFLFECKKTVKMEDENQNSENEELKKEKIINDLESKIKVQQTYIKELTDKVNYKQTKIEVLSENYKQQIECLKKEFNFEGDMKLLLSGNQCTKEAKYARSVRDALDNCKVKSLRIFELENKIIELKQQIERLKHIEGLRQADRTMVNMYLKTKEDVLFEERKLKMNNNQYKEIEDLKRRHALLEKINNEYKKELKKKNKLICNLPSTFQIDEGNQVNMIQQVKNETRTIMKEHFKKEIESINNNLFNENNIYSEKQVKIIHQKNDEILRLKAQYSKLKNSQVSTVNSYLNESLKLKETIDNLIYIYKTCFDIKKFGKNINSLHNFNILLNLKTDFEKQLTSVEQNLNQYQYPLLFTSLNLQGPSRTKTKVYAIKVPELNNNIYSDSIDNNINQNLLKHSLKHKDIPIEIVEKKKEKLFKHVKTNGQLEQMKQEELINYIKSLHNNIDLFEEYAEEYIKYKTMFNEDDFEKNSTLIQQLNEKNVKLKLLLDEQVSENNKNKVLLSTNQRNVERLNSENFMLKTALNSKNLSKKISFPLLWTTSYKKTK